MPRTGTVPVDRASRSIPVRRGGSRLRGDSRGRPPKLESASRALSARLKAALEGAGEEQAGAYNHDEDEADQHRDPVYTRPHGRLSRIGSPTPGRGARTLRRNSRLLPAPSPVDPEGSPHSSLEIRALLRILRRTIPFQRRKGLALPTWTDDMAPGSRPLDLSDARWISEGEHGKRQISPMHAGTAGQQRPVPADERVTFAKQDHEVHIPQRLNTTETLGNPRLKDRFRHFRGSRPPQLGPRCRARGRTRPFRLVLASR